MSWDRRRIVRPEQATITQWTSEHSVPCQYGVVGYGVQRVLNILTHAYGVIRRPA